MGSDAADSSMDMILETGRKESDGASSFQEFKKTEGSEELRLNKDIQDVRVSKESDNDDDLDKYNLNKKLSEMDSQVRQMHSSKKQVLFQAETSKTPHSEEDPIKITENQSVDKPVFTEDSQN